MQLHLFLLEFIPAEDDQLFGMVLAQHDFANFFPNDPVPPVIITLELDQSIGFMFGYSLQPKTHRPIRQKTLERPARFSRW